MKKEPPTRRKGRRCCERRNNDEARNQISANTRIKIRVSATGRVSEKEELKRELLELKY